MSIIGVAERRKKLEKLLHISLKNIGTFSLDESVASSRNCEAMIGVAQVPMGVAGPVRLISIRSRQALNCYIPLATTEGALVASVNRGCKAITESGGAKVYIEKVGASRGPVFKIKNIEEGLKLDRFIESHFIDLKKVASKTSKHIKLRQVRGQILGGCYFARFTFDTGEAMGMNMVTIATEAVAGYIKKETGVTCLSVSGNFCVDKKPSWQNFILGRGMKINAEVVLTKSVLKKTLKTTAQKFVDVWEAKCMVGSAVSGSMGFNAQFANVLAAIFLATGQDIAHVTEGSLGITTAKIVGESLKVGVYLPDIMIGTVGGGTGLATQSEALSIVGKKNLAIGIGGAVLAGEISLLASLSEGSLGDSHRKLGRAEKI